MRIDLCWLKTTVKRAALLLRVNRLLAVLTKQSIILGYHRVIEHSDSLLVVRIGAVSPTEFSAHLAYLEELGYPIRSLDVALGEPAGRCAAITFDDGFKDLFFNAFPILAARSAPFTLFAITATIDRTQPIWQHRLYEILDDLDPEARCRALADALAEASGAIAAADDQHLLDADYLIGRIISSMKPSQVLKMVTALEGHSKRPSAIASEYLSTDELNVMTKAGLTVESHGHEHWNLCNLDPDELRQEIFRSRERAMDFNPRPCVYSIAHGISSDYVLTEIGNCGYRRVLTGEFGVIKDMDQTRIPRIWPNGSKLEFSWLLTRVLVASLLSRLRAAI